jgi:hypothetical protein
MNLRRNPGLAILRMFQRSSKLRRAECCSSMISATCLPHYRTAFDSRFSAQTGGPTATGSRPRAGTGLTGSKKPRSSCQRAGANSHVHCGDRLARRSSPHTCHLGAESVGRCLEALDGKGQVPLGGEHVLVGRRRPRTAGRSNGGWPHS